MGLFKRLKNIIRSNVNFEKEKDIQINCETYEKLFDDDDEILQAEVSHENDREKEYYGILELKYGASFDEIKTAYRKLLRKYHPDLYNNNPEKLQIAKQITEKINEAYGYFEKKYL